MKQLNMSEFIKQYSSEELQQAISDWKILKSTGSLGDSMLRSMGKQLVTDYNLGNHSITTAMYMHDIVFAIFEHYTDLYLISIKD